MRSHPAAGVGDMDLAPLETESIFVFRNQPAGGTPCPSPLGGWARLDPPYWDSKPVLARERERIDSLRRQEIETLCQPASRERHRPVVLVQARSDSSQPES